jgi:hypothetical protein
MIVKIEHLSAFEKITGGRKRSDYSLQRLRAVPESL